MIIMEIFDRELFDSRRTTVNIDGTNVHVTWVQDDQLCSLEAWGDHGPNDFDDYGFRLKQQDVNISYITTP